MGLPTAVSQQEFEAGLSLLDMMQRNPSEDKSGDGQETAAAGAGTDQVEVSLLRALHQQPTAVTEKTASRALHHNTPSSEQSQASWVNQGLLRRNTQLTSLSRELSLEELRAHFGKPIVEVAREFGICTTFLKKICRRCGIKRWPHRQIRSLSRTIQMLKQAECSSTSPQEKTKFAAQIRQLEAKMQAVIEDPDANGKLERVKKCSAVKSAAAVVHKARSDTKKDTSSSGVCVPQLAIPSPQTSTMESETDDEMLSQPVTPSARGGGSSNVPQALSLQAKHLMESRDGQLSSATSTADPTTMLGLRISPSHRKLLAHTKGASESRLRASSIGSLQEDEGESGRDVKDELKRYDPTCVSASG